jgi:hypothetical protein
MEKLKPLTPHKKLTKWIFLRSYYFLLAYVNNISGFNYENSIDVYMNKFSPLLESLTHTPIPASQQNLFHPLLLRT